MSEFFQEGPSLANPFDSDPLLGAFLEWRLPRDVREAIVPGLRQLGERVICEMPALADAAEADPPRLEQFDPWGRRVDRIVTSPAWARLHAIAAEEGIVAAAFERREGPWSRLHQFCRLYLYHPSSALVTCPLAMTDGAARVLELHGSARLRREALPRLTSREAERFWTSGQWMTERSGGSDVSGSETTARAEGDGYRLHGSKWFTSAVTSDVALTLARLPGMDELSLFYLETRRPDGTLNGIRIQRLKDKLGTRALPTAELALEDTRAELVGAPGRGVATIATMLNITRLYNACCAVATMRRGLALATDYARRRSAFGKALSEHPLHVETLAGLELEVSAAMHFVLHLAALLGREETGEASTTERELLRLLTPLAKLYTGKQGVAVISEILECFGGAGYIEDTGLPRLLRDAQVLPIWEGTTNVLSLDVLRVLHKSEAAQAYREDIEQRLAGVRDPSLSASGTRVRQAVSVLDRYLRALDPGDPEAAEAGARGLAFGLARCYMGALMLEQAESQRGRPLADARAAAARRWCAHDLAPVRAVGPEERNSSRLLVFGA